jgi:O-antigen/teichoic acid export membrane protein
MPAATRTSAMGIGDQILSSATNFLTAFVASYVLAPDDFGAFVVAYAVVTVALATVRALVGEPLLAHLPTLAPERQPAAARSALGAAALLGVAAGALLLALGLSGVPTLAALVWFAPWVPVVVVQDAFRFVALCRSRTGAALALDVTWAVVQAVALTLTFGLGGLSVATLASSWGVGALGGVLVAAVLFPADWRRPADPRPWMRQSRHLSGWFTLTSVLGQAEIYTVLILAGVLLAPVDAAGLRAVQLMVYQPAATLMGAMLVLVTPLIARAAAASDVEAVRAVRRVTLIGSGVLAAVLLAVVPARGVLLATFFPQYTAFGALVLPLALQSAVVGLSVASHAMVRGYHRARPLFYGQIVHATLLITAAVVGMELGGVLGLGWALALESVVPLLGLAWLAPRLGPRPSSRRPNAPPVPRVPAR